MRKIKLLALIASVVALVCVFGVVAFAAAPSNETTGESGDVTLATEYGNFVIPSQYADAEAYPFVAFNSDGRFIHASKVFCSGDDSKGGIMNKDYHTSKEETHYIFLRTDYTCAGGGKTFWNFAWTLSEVVVDLQGHTFTLTNSPSEGLLYGEGKAAGVNVRFTMQNGTYNSKTTRSLFMAQPSTKTTTFTFNFKNMVIKSDESLASNTAERYLLATLKDKVGSPVVNYSMNFIDCTVDLTNLGPNARLFVTDSHKCGNIESSYNFQGGTIIGDLSKLITFRHEDTDNLKFSKNANGQYTTNTVVAGAAAPSRILLSEEGLLTFKAADAVTLENGNTVYTPTVETSEFATKYGWLPEDDAIITVFDASTQKVVYSGNMMINGENATTGPNAILATDSASATFVIYLRGDVPTTSFGATFYNFSRKSNTIIFEMNGHTMTLNKELFRAQLKASGMVQRIIINNGTINLNGKNLMQYGLLSKAAGAALYATYNGVTFSNISGGAYMFNPAVVDGDVDSTFVQTFNGCEFNFSSNYSGVLFFAKHKNIKVQFIVNGGCFNTPKTSLPTISNIATTASSVQFGPDAEGNFPVFVTKGGNSTVAGKEVFNTPYGTKVVFKNAGKNADGNTLWTLAEETPYGYIPTEYLNSTLYPFAIFDGKNNFLIATEKLNGTDPAVYAFQYVKNNMTANATMQLYVRRDYTTGSALCKDMGKMPKSSTFIFDLGGHTLTLGGTLLWAHSEASANLYNTQIIKNGTINNGSYYVYGGGNQWNTKQFYVTFENITFNNIKSPVFVTPVQLSTNSGYIAHYYVTFENCTFNVEDSFTGNIFHVGDAKNANGEYCRASITVNGGTVNSNGKAVLYKVVNTAFVSNSIHFGPDKNGNYTTFNNAETALSNLTPLTKDTNKPLVMRKTGENSFVLTPFAFVSTYLNLKNNLNIVYRVCLPEGYTNPVATFIIGEDTVTVNEYTIDENGLYCFTLTSVAPHKMGDFVNATVVATYNGAEETISNNQVSIKAYADALRTQYAEDTAMLALLDSLLVYGAASQVYMNYNLDALVAEIGELASVLEAPITMSGETSAIANITACGLMLDGAFDLRVGIKATTLEGLTLEITKGDKTTVVELTADMMKGEYLTVYYDGLNINELDTEVSFTLKQNGVAVGKTLTFSANAYLYRMQNSENTALATLTKALYAYGNAAKAYTA